MISEPSAPKLEGQVGEDGNSIKVNFIKQDDGGSPIRHYLIRYRVMHSSDWKPEIRLPSGSDHVMLKSLDWNAEYEVSVTAENQQGRSKAAFYTFRTSAQPTIIPASTSPTSGLGTAAIVGILIVIFILLLVAVDVTCYFLNKCGLLMCIAINLCGKSGPGAKGKDMEEGKAAFSHSADATAATEDMMPSVTTVTTNSDTITETFATAQNSPTSETTTLTSSITLPATPMPDSNSMAPGQGTPSKAAVASSSPPPSSTPAPKVAPLVDLSDTPTSTPSSGNLSSTVLSNQGGVLSPNSSTKAPEAPKGSTVASKSPAPPPPHPTSPPASSESKQEASASKSPEKDATQTSVVKSPTEAAKNGANQKVEAATGGAANPTQNEDFKMDEGSFKTPDIDLAKDVFAALGTSAPATAPGGQAASSSAPETSTSPAPAKTEKTPVEEKSVIQATEAKTAPAEVKTVPNEATQTNENESKA
ncbi:hypothetical protein JD844_031586 [Phrynosoma platyrhinos]|uniref:Fibronectin type-III domain-containing protein n=1 Tax=Phrynosoma platyrhinos TaxID=52577 RepID=A0ABQ7T178_PHRPL|nr:hypothetical protein JD844_031586 [Phrynosoma platyrhinos]